MYNFKQVLGATSYRPWKKWIPADYIVGKFVSEGQDKFGNSTYKIEVIEAGFEIAPPAVGSYFTLNSSGSLKKAFADIEEGQVVKIIYKGVELINKGKFAGKEFHNMEVMVADGSPITADDSDELI